MIDDFKASVTNMSKATLFEVESTELGREFGFLCKSASLPGVEIGVVEIPYMGRKIKIAGDKVYAAWEITIQLDTSFKVKRLLEDWSEQINGAETNSGTVSVSEYKRDMTIRSLNTDGSVISEYKLIGCWPSSIGAVDLSFESNDTISEMSVTLDYDYFLRVK